MALRTVVIGVVGGALGGLGVWLIASAMLDKSFREGAARLSGQLSVGGATLESRLAQGRAELEARVREQVQSQVPPVVRSELTNTLRTYGITPQTGQQITRILNNAERLGII